METNVIDITGRLDLPITLKTFAGRVKAGEYKPSTRLGDGTKVTLEMVLKGLSKLGGTVSTAKYQAELEHLKERERKYNELSADLQNKYINEIRRIWARQAELEEILNGI